MATEPTDTQVDGGALMRAVMALSGGMDGLESCRQVIAGATKALGPGGLLLLEHHHDQSDAVLILMRDQGLTDVAFKFDLQGVRRFALGRHPDSLPLPG